MEIYTTRYLPCSFFFINLIIILRVDLLIKNATLAPNIPL